MIKEITTSKAPLELFVQNHNFAVVSVCIREFPWSTALLHTMQMNEAIHPHSSAHSQR